MIIDVPHTPIPNHWLDNLSRMKPGVMAVCMIVARQTWGYATNKANPKERREWDRISTSQFMRQTGLSNRAVIDAIQDAINDGWIERKPKGQSYEYRVAPMKKVHRSESETYEKSSQVDGETCEKSSQEPMKKVHTQKKERKKRKDSSPNGNASPANANSRTPKPSRAGKKKPSQAYVNPDTGVSSADILQAYVECMANAEPQSSVNYGREGKAAKELAQNGWKAQQVVTCFWKLKRDEFWQNKHLSLQSVSTQIGAVMGKSIANPLASNGQAVAYMNFNGSEK